MSSDELEIDFKPIAVALKRLMTPEIGIIIILLLLLFLMYHYSAVDIANCNQFYTEQIKDRCVNFNFSLLR